jgi:hypothetical protein
MSIDSEEMEDKEAIKIEKLAENSLNYKWIDDQKKNLNRILNPCSFCFSVKAKGNDCSKCKIPAIICYDDGKKGLIGFILSIYGNVFLKDIDRNLYELIIQALKEILKHGKLTNDIEKKISSIIDNALF